MTARVAVVVLLLSALALAIFAGCGTRAGDEPAPAANPASEPSPVVATAVAQAEATVMASYANSGTDYCGRLCQPSFWVNASVADLDAEISKGAGVNARGGSRRDGRSPLHLAVSYADISVIAALLDRGADIEAKDHFGFTALFIAGTDSDYFAFSYPHHIQRYDTVALLLEHGADANAPIIDGGIQLHYTIDPVIATLLLHYGADVNHVDDFGRTPLIAAVQSREFDTVTLLLEHGADINAKDADGRTACQSLEVLTPSEIAVLEELVCP